MDRLINTMPDLSLDDDFYADFDDFEDAEEFWQDDDVDFDHDYVLLDNIYD